jgi:hypothetical protein
MDRANLDTRRVFALLALHGHIEKPLLRDQRRVVVMLGVFKIDKVSSLEPDDPDPMELRLITGIIVFFYTGIDALSAPNASGKFKTVTPQRLGKSSLCADLEFLLVLLCVPCLQLVNDVFLFFRGHFAKMLLQEILSLFLGARGECGKGDARQGGQGKIAKELSSRIMFTISILHCGFLPDD